VSDEQLRGDFAALGDTMQMNWQLHDAHKKPRMLIMVSKIGHCLNDLLFRYKSGLLPVEIPAIVSNHTDFYQLSASYNIPFHHLPLAPGASAAAKQAQRTKCWTSCATAISTSSCWRATCRSCRPACARH
jgi:formyltetrahydrofolate deformylase